MSVEGVPLPYQLPAEGPMWTKADYEMLREMGILMPEGCGDDRWPHGGIQFFGGHYGVSLGYGTAMNMRNNNFDAAATGIDQAVDQLAVVTQGALEAQGILGLNHIKCAGALSMKAIALTGIVQPGMSIDKQRTAERQRKEALAHVRTYSEMSDARFDEVSDELAHVATKHVRDPEVAQKAMLPTSDKEWVCNEAGLLVPTSDGIPRVPIGTLNHEAEIVAISDDPDHVFETMVAWEAGQKAYHVSMGHLPRVHRAIDSYMGRGAAKYEDMRDAIAVFTAKTVLNLPTPVEGQPLGVQYLERVAAAT